MAIDEESIDVGLTGKKLRTFEQTTSAGQVHVEAISIADPDAARTGHVAEVYDTGPPADADGLVTRVVSSALPTGAATFAEQQTQTASLSVLDDWDESDRAKVNPIVGQAGVEANTGAITAKTIRTTLATDDPSITVLNQILAAITALEIAAAVPTTLQADFVVPAHTQVTAGHRMIVGQGFRITLEEDSALVIL